MNQPAQNHDRILKADGLIIPDTLSVPDYVDTREMTAKAVITTAAEDREGDIILPAGCRLSEYQLNPVVLWEHGKKEITQPIAKCCNPQMQVSIQVTDDEVIAKSYFTSSDKISAQIFSLIAEGFVRATSIQAIPIEAERRKASNGMAARLVKVWELIEWSWCSLGMNPEAVAKVLDLGKIDGSSIAEPILKTLQAATVKTDPFFKGIDIPKEKPVADETTEETTDETTQEPTEKAVDETTEETETTETTEETEPVDQDLEKMDTTDEEDDSDSPMGAKILASIHRDLASIKSSVDMAMKSLEQPVVQAAINELVADLEGKLQEIEGVHNEVYPDREPIARMDEAEEKSANEAAQKSLGEWLSVEKHKYRLAGVTGRLKQIYQSSKMSPQQKDLQIAKSFQDLKNIERDAMKYKPVDYQKQINDLAEIVGGLITTVDNVLPAEK